MQCRRQCARLENRLFDWAWVKSCWRPVKRYRTIKRGKRKGWIEVELFEPRGRKVIVSRQHIHYKEADYI